MKGTEALKACAFCSHTLQGRASREHILPEWLLAHLGIRDHQISPTHFSSSGDTVSTRYHPLRNLLAGRICSTCNNGWMSRLESAAQEHLKALFANNISVVELNEADRFVLARWVLKTAMTLNLGSNYLKNIPSAHYSHLCEKPTTLPEHVAAFAQNHHHTQEFFWIQGPAWSVSAQTGTIDTDTVTVLEQQSYKVSFQFRALLLTVAYNPLPDYLFSIWRGTHVPLYPSRGPIAWFDREEFPLNDSHSAVVAFHAGLGLARTG